MVTGVNGFVGKHLVRELEKRHMQILGVGQDPKPSAEIEPILAGYFECDLTQRSAVAKLPLQNINVVIGLAGLARVGDSFGAEQKYKKTNVEVISVLAEEILSHNLNTKVIAVSTGAVYDSSQPMPLSEISRLVESGSPYAESKILMERKMGELRKRGLQVTIVRPFNHIGPGQEPGFLLPDLYQKINEAYKNNKPLAVGNLKTRRDYTDVRDVVKAYADLAKAQNPQQNTFNVCSGRSIAGEDLLELLLQKMNLAGTIKIETDPKLLRPNDPADIYGSYENIQQQTGWVPSILLQKTIEDFVDSKS